MSRWPVLVTLFTRKNCGLCIEASSAVARSRELVKSRDGTAAIRWTTVDIDEPVHREWKIYDFDVPVV